ncbi:MAG TPA: DUF3379 family protein [Steroidobacteraceae bacterium]|nr:DUF3379 family protein [Steroidobacteraceae bacterium]
MTHDEARLLIGAAPAEVDPPLAEHLAHCAECSLFQQQMRRMDQDLARVLALPLGRAPARGAAPRVISLPAVAHARAVAPRRALQPMALAASVIICLGLGILFWTLRPQPSLAAAVLDHVALEPGSWSEVAPMTAAASDRVLSGAGVSLDRTDATITYARICLFKGHWVPHLVVRTATGPVTLMVLRQDHTATRQVFRQNGYSGILVPMPAGGTLAVISRGQPDMDAVARELDPHLHWTP